MSTFACMCMTEEQADRAVAGSPLGESEWVLLYAVLGGFFALVFWALVVYFLRNEGVPWFARVFLILSCRDDDSWLRFVAEHGIPFWRAPLRRRDGRGGDPLSCWAVATVLLSNLCFTLLAGGTLVIPLGTICRGLIFRLYWKARFYQGCALRHWEGDWDIDRAPQVPDGREDPYDIEAPWNIDRGFGAPDGNRNPWYLERASSGEAFLHVCLYGLLSLGFLEASLRCCPRFVDRWRFEKGTEADLQPAVESGRCEPPVESTDQHSTETE